MTGPTNLTAGANFNLTIQALDPFGNLVSGYQGTIDFTSSDTKAVLPGTYTFIPSDNGSHIFTGLLLETAGNQTVSANDLSGINGNTVISVSPGAASNFNLTVPVSASKGDPFTASVAALDQFGNAATGYRGTIAFSSSDATATLPANYLFTAADVGTHTFVNAIILSTVGPQTVKVADMSNGSLQTTQSLNVTPDVPLSAGPRTIRIFRSVTPLVVASVIDGDDNETGSHLSAVVDWGDGTTSTGVIVLVAHNPTTFDVLGNHSYLHRGVYPVTVTIIDSQGSQAVVHSTASFFPRSFSY